MLAGARLQTLVWTANIKTAECFYSDTLGLSLTGNSHGALVYDVGGGELRVSPVPDTKPSEHTVVGFAVEDVHKLVLILKKRGVVFERFAHFDHDEHANWSAPDGTKVAWFRDPDGNLLSVVQYA